MDPDEAKEIRSALNDVLRNGEAERLKNMLTNVLLDCGWKAEVDLMCRKVIEEKGAANVSPDDIVREVASSARAKVPAELKQLLMEKVRAAVIKKLEERERENSEGQH